MVQVRVFQETLATDGTNPSIMRAAGSTSEIDTNHANYIVAMGNGIIVGGLLRIEKDDTDAAN